MRHVALRRPRVGTACLVALATVAAVVVVPAHSAAQPAMSPDGADAGAPVATCVADRPRVRHLVLFDEGTDAATAEAAIAAACGAITVFHPEIAVAVATSADSSFVDRVGGPDRAYSAQAEGLTGAERPARTPEGTQSVSAGVAAGTSTEVGAAAEITAAAGVAAAAADRSGEQWGLAMINADRAHAIERGSDDVLVGVLDSGIDASHPDLAPALDLSRSAGCLTGRADPRPSAWAATDAHGTHVAGIVAATGDGSGVTGVAPGVRLAAVKVVDRDGLVYPEAVVCGFMWAARQGMTVTVNSYFVDPWLFTCAHVPGQSVVREALRRAQRHATDRGVLAVAAAGNEAVDLTRVTVDSASPTNRDDVEPRPIDADCAVLPAGLPDVLTVSAVGAAAEKSSYSSYGAGVVDVAAPGGDLRQRSAEAKSGCVLSTVPGGGYDRMCGTSMATPHAAGVAALAASAHPGAGPLALADIVRSTATTLACPGTYDPDSDGRADATCTSARDGGDDNSFYGAGLVDALAAVAAGH